jgi:hypothetical protein
MQLAKSPPIPPYPELPGIPANKLGITRAPEGSTMSKHTYGLEQRRLATAVDPRDQIQAGGEFPGCMLKTSQRIHIKPSQVQSGVVTHNTFKKAKCASA